MKSYFERTASDVVHFGWGHGQYADLWSLVHFMSGLIFGTTALFLQIPHLYALILIIVGAVIYEALEVASGVVEDLENAITDIVIAGIAAMIAIYGFDTLPIATSALLLAVTLLGNIILIHFGWNAYLKRKAYSERSHKYLLMALQGLTVLSILATVFVVAKWVW